MTKKDWRFIDKWTKKIMSINYLGGKCNKCGNDNIFYLTFHHKYDKKFTIGDNHNYGWNKLKNELDKCEILCKNCHQEMHFLENTIDNSLRNNKNIYLDYKGVECNRCGYNKCQSALEFHHTDSSVKMFSINTNRIRYINELDEYLKNELDKCEVLCSNCHNNEHIDKDRFEFFRDKIYEKVYSYKIKQPKISREKVYEMYNNGIKQIDIAKYFNASKGTISSIIKKIKNN